MESTRRAASALILALAFVAASCGSGSATADSGQATATNLELMRTLATRLAASCMDSIGAVGSPRVRLRVLPQESGWMLEEAIRNGLASGGARAGDASFDLVAEFGILEMRVSYENIRRDGFMGPRIMDRLVSVSLHATISDSASTRELFAGDRRDALRDTVLVSEAGRLETPILPVTVGSLPEEGVFENIAEPFIVLAAVAVAMVLLFTVRS